MCIVIFSSKSSPCPSYEAQRTILRFQGWICITSLIPLKYNTYHAYVYTLTFYYASALREVKYSFFKLYSRFDLLILTKISVTESEVFFRNSKRQNMDSLKCASYGRFLSRNLHSFRPH